jgi:hypothetical protein
MTIGAATRLPLTPWLEIEAAAAQVRGCQLVIARLGDEVR